MKKNLKRGQRDVFYSSFLFDENVVPLFDIVLGLFNVIQFANEMCNGTSNDNLGICYTSSECSTMVNLY